jgi:Fe2+ or Zn2+ uptake regulation protein
MACGVVRRFERLDELPLDDAEYGTAFPILDAHEHSTCQKCGAAYDAEQFMALALPDVGESVWRYESSNVSIAVRKCERCANMLGRRIRAT